MATIDERITDHEILRRKAYDKREKVEADLNNINEKIIYHTAAIMNLENKKPKPKV